MQQLTNSVLLEVYRSNSSIRFFSVIPFCTMDISVGQLEALKNMKSSFLTLHVIPVRDVCINSLGLSNIRKYRIHASNPMGSGPTVPIIEFHAQNDSTEAVAMALRKFRDR